MSKAKRISSHPDFPIRERSTVGHFAFGRRRVPYVEGDTIASALFAAGVTVFSRSFKYHRPRGLYDGHGFGADVLVTVDGVPNLLADRILARDGLDISSQNAWPSLSFDLAAINDFAVPLLPNGFYYKMFHKPRWAWPFFEKRIRAIAGLGRINSTAPTDHKRYEKRYRFPDVCVVGAGPAGLSAARSAADAGAHVLLLERADQLGGHALHGVALVQGATDDDLKGLPEHTAVRQLCEAVRSNPNIEIITEAACFGIYEDGLVMAEQGTDLFKIRAGAVIVASGASDRHLVFNRNDLPGIMTARGVERLVAIHGIAPGARAVVVTNHDRGYHTARILAGAGVELAAIVDSRLEGDPGESEKWITSDTGISVRIVKGSTIRRAKGFSRVRGAAIGTLDSESLETIDCDLIVTAVGFSPQLGLLSMGRSKPLWDSQRDVYRVRDLPVGLYGAGDINGPASFARLQSEGKEIGEAAAAGRPAPDSRREHDDLITALPADVGCGSGKRFICRCMDVTRSEIQKSIAEGYDQIETLKRFTSMGMGRCQGKTCYEAAARLSAVDAGHDAPPTSPTTMRPPFSPVSFGVLAGRAPHLIPVRRTPMHDAHVRLGASFLSSGLWVRPETYTSTAAEVEAVRNALGIIDVSTLGKLELSGPDVLRFLHFMMPGKYAKLAVGRVRYTTMVGEDGVIFEDGTLAHLEQGRYYLSTTTGNAEAIRSNFRWWLESEDFDVDLIDRSAALAAVNLSGPRSRDFLATLVDIDVSNEALPYMGCRAATVEGIRVQLFRIGFTGELSFELHFPAEYGESMWDYLIAKGAAHGITPFGVESQRVLRLEKGHLIPGTDTDALSSPFDAGVGATIKLDKPDFIGKAFLGQLSQRDPRETLVTYAQRAGEPIPDDGVVILEGSRIIGRVTSARLSPTLGHGVGLAWVEAEFAKPGTSLKIRLANGSDTWGEVLGDHAAYDPEGLKLRS